MASMPWAASISIIGVSWASTITLSGPRLSMFIDSHLYEAYCGWRSGSVERGASRNVQSQSRRISGTVVMGRSGLVRARPGRSGTQVASMWMAR